MKRLIFIILSALSVVMATASPASGESLNYRVMYKWGLVNKQAGTVNLSTRRDGDGYFKSVLTAKSAKWADGIYRVRDTLRGTIDNATIEPVYYEKISHEGGQFKHDIITYSRSGKTVRAHCVRHRQKKSSAPLSTSEIDLEAEGFTLDMLSAFYFMRSIDYESMKPGESQTMNVFSGKRKEILTITYHGERTIKIKGKEFTSYYITFRFTGEGGKKTSDDMDAWIGTGPDRIPLKLEGKLPVGKVQCFFMDQDK